MECPLCRAELDVPFDYAEIVVQCPICSDYFKVPSIQECPHCLKRSFRKRKVCEECGCDFAAEEADLEEESGNAEKPSVPQRLLLLLAEACPGLFRIPALLTFLVTVVFLGITIFLGITVFLMGAYLSAGSILAAGLVVYWHGAAALCTGEICGLKSAFGELRGAPWEAFSILAFGPVLLGFLAMGFAKYFVH